MNSKKKILYTIFLIILLGCEKKENNGFMIKGKIINFNNSYIYLTYDNVVDSCLVKNNTFNFKGEVENPKLAILYPDSPSSSALMTIGSVMLENNVINVTASYSTENTALGLFKMLDIDSISGSKSQIIRDIFEEKIEMTVLYEQNDSIKNEALYNNLYEFLNNNPKSEMSGEYLANFSTLDNNLTISQIKNLIKLIDTNFQEKRNLKKIEETIDQRKLFEIGDIPPDIILPDQKGIMTDRNVLSGKIVLLEFWASWCIPCRQTNPKLIEIYNTTKNNGFEIFGISTDTDVKKWKTAIEKDKLSWIQVIDTVGIISEKYKINYVPFNLLLNRNGKIMAINIKPFELEVILKKEL